MPFRGHLFNTGTLNKTNAQVDERRRDLRQTGVAVQGHWLRTDFPPTLAVFVYGPDEKGLTNKVFLVRRSHTGE